jgi:ethanolamine utilization protein EutN
MGAREKKAFGRAFKRRLNRINSSTTQKIMFLAKVEGTVVSTKKDAAMGGRKLLLLRPQLVDDKDPTKFRPGANTIVSVDSIGAGLGEMVLFCQGSSARLASGLKDTPVDAVVIGIVDAVDVLGKQIYNARSTT